jgi:hypothetical protein
MDHIHDLIHTEKLIAVGSKMLAQLFMIRLIQKVEVMHKIMIIE